MKPTCIVSCPIDTFSGYGHRSRDFVRSLIEAKGNDWDIKILPQIWGDTPWGFLDKDDPLKSKIIQQLTQQPDVWIQITIPNEFQKVGRFSLERPIEVLFEGLDTGVYFKNPGKSGLLDNIDESFCFLFTGHWLPGSFGEDRKNVATMIKTFFETFKGRGPKPALLLKVNRSDYSLLDKEEILRDIRQIRNKFDYKENLPNIYILHGEFTNEELNKINNDSKIKSFISFTKGEGFGRPLLEQAITGKPVITTNWSGHVDFIRPEYNVLLGGELKNIHPSASNKWLIKEAQWFNVNTEIDSSTP